MDKNDGSFYKVRMSGDGIIKRKKQNKCIQAKRTMRGKEELRKSSAHDPFR